MNQKSIIFHVLGDWNEAKPFYVEAITLGFTSFLIDQPGIAEKVRDLGLVQVISPLASEEPDINLVDATTGPASMNGKTAVSIDLSTKKDEQKVLSLAKEGFDMVIINAKDWKVIPYENLIADLQKEETSLVATVQDVEEARLFFETLEVGVDGVLYDIDARSTEVDSFNFDAWKEFLDASGRLDMSLVEITKIEELGSGDRVCVDTISMLRQGEGMLVGSQARGFFLLHGEIADTEFVNSRPFRVNAGAVHSYTLGLGNKTKYLSELEAGSQVLIASHEGNTRTTRVGRIKIETRPMLLVEARGNGITISAVIQNAETICLVDKDGAQISVAKLKIGDKVQAHLTGVAGRHFGKDIEEKIIEK